MNISPLRFLTWSAIALSPLGFASAALAAPGSFVVPTVPINAPTSAGGAFPYSRSPGAAVVIPMPNSSPLPRYPTPYPTGTSSGKLPPLPNRITPTPIPQPSILNGKLAYRVVVNGADAARVSAVVPGAFRTLVNGQSVVQAGVFREQGKATELQQILNRNNLQAMILPVQANEVPSKPVPSTSPSLNPTLTPLPIPKSGITVVIDPGHGGGDPGAIGIGGLQEKEITLSVSQQVVALLKQKGVNAVLTRSGDQEVELAPRVDFAEQANADVFVSIHANSFTASRTDVSGIETYYSSSDGLSLARTIQTNLLQELGARDRGVKQANFYVIKYTDMPAALVEIGFVTGAEDAARLASATGRTKIAQAIARAILQYVQS
ncbi:N-acetylmuramoyl-L-alanine amidase family protein [Leptolyngbya sp. Cla-17]|uniref:N-acetylmuramoyl-L-alanine amidase family protein n=1 Tax=Leptolyngbya sp. Cla-17 TaxID=2803751 RepID=UPI0014919F38|nr:N-acetylmuramoyl-L-alanine amidase [Leptolyngbya sp. Cla-17]